MAAKPIERFVKKQIQEQGGWERILERIASGETIAKIAGTILRPDGKPISRSFLSWILHRDAERSQLIHQARREGAHALVDHAIEIVRTAPSDRDSTNKAKVIADVDLKVAGLWNREEYGERQPTVAVQVNLGQEHLNALRHREIRMEQVLEPEIAAFVEANKAGGKEIALSATGARETEATLSLPHGET